MSGFIHTVFMHVILYPHRNYITMETDCYCLQAEHRGCLLIQFNHKLVPTVDGLLSMVPNVRKNKINFHCRFGKVLSIKSQVRKVPGLSHFTLSYKLPKGESCWVTVQ